MWKTFIAEFKALWNSRLRFASWIILLFMPLIYGFLFLSSFWSPFKNTDKLPIVVVNLDKTTESYNLVDALTNDGENLVFNGGSSEYKIHIKDASDIYDNKEEVEKKVNEGTYSAAFVIPQGYGKIASDIRNKIIIDLIDGNINANAYLDFLKKEINDSGNGLIDFYNSFKASYVAGEMTNMGSSLYKLIGDLIFPDAKMFEKVIGQVDPLLSDAIHNLAKFQTNAAIKIASGVVNKTGSDVNTIVGLAKTHVLKAESILESIFGTDSVLKNDFTNITNDLDNLMTAQSDEVNDLVTKITDDLTNLNLKISGLSSNVLLPIINDIKEKVLGDLKAGNMLVNHRIYGKREGVVGEHDVLNTYGYGLSPYFISIVLWAGALLMAFLFPNKRYIKTEGTFNNLMGKTFLWILTGWIQVLLLFAIISIPGIFGSITYHLSDGTFVTVKQCINLGSNQWQLIFFALYMSTVFMMIVRGILYTLRVADIGIFVVVILLILQLTSSGGTFPVQMQPGFFQFMHKILPFTYTVEGIREIFWDPSVSVIMKDFGVLLIFPTVFMISSYISNKIWDQKTKYKIDGETRYRSMDKNVGSL